MKLVQLLNALSICVCLIPSSCGFTWVHVWEHAAGAGIPFQTLDSVGGERASQKSQETIRADEEEQH
jgi:hypothetical protein